MLIWCKRPNLIKRLGYFVHVNIPLQFSKVIGPKRYLLERIQFKSFISTSTSKRASTYWLKHCIGGGMCRLIQSFGAYWYHLKTHWPNKVCVVEQPLSVENKAQVWFSRGPTFLCMEVLIQPVFKQLLNNSSTTSGAYWYHLNTH